VGVYSRRETDERWSTSRVEAFSDGVFAIAITLLVLDISIEPSQFQHLWRALAREWPSYLAYVTSFLTVGAVWITHHRLFVRLRYVDPGLLRLNIALLMVAAFLPFPTGLVAEAFHSTEQAERAAVVVYGATAGAIELLLVLIWRYASSRPALLHEDAPPPPAAWRFGGGGVGATLYGLAILVGAALLPRASAVAYLLVAARAVFFTGAEGRLTLGHLRRRH
jgi:uncharacterized membrane protein